MEMELVEPDVAQLVLSDRSFGPKEIEQISGSISRDFANYRLMRDSVSELELREPHTPATAVRLGVCYYLMGRYAAAIRTLEEGDRGALTHFYLGKSHVALDNYDKAKECYTAAAGAGYDRDACSLAIAETLRLARRGEEALQILDSLSGAIEQTAEYLYQRGATVGAIGGKPSEPVALFERAVETDASHAGALFGLALYNDRAGNDDTAVSLYERSSSCFPSHVGALLNLGIMYEDGERYDRAASCYQRILDVYPDNPRARLYLKDSRASGNQFYDDDERRKSDRLAQVLSIPVTDFELSVRSRNCLQRMGINRLGDLARTTEHELLASKNFGETSLVEIREILAAKDLRLGELAHEKKKVEPSYDPETLSEDERHMHERPITDLNLSVRARKCMVRLGINTIGQLVRRTGDEMLECKNFGVTSLNEVREKLGPVGLKLRGD